MFAIPLHCSCFVCFHLVVKLARLLSSNLNVDRLLKSRRGAQPTFSKQACVPVVGIRLV